MKRKNPPLVESRWFLEKDLNTGHLEPQQGKKLIELLKEINVSKSPELRKVKIVEHKIDVGEAKLIRQQPYRVPIAKKEVIDKEVEKMLVKEILWPLVSRSSSSIVLITKPDGSARFCIDY